MGGRRCQDTSALQGEAWTVGEGGEVYVVCGEAVMGAHICQHSANLHENLRVSVKVCSNPSKQ